MSCQQWYNIFIEKLFTIYSEQIIIEDSDNIIDLPEIKNALSKQFAVTQYSYELELRKFISENSSKQIIIIINSKLAYIPYDIISNSERISWNLSDIFPNFNKTVLKDFKKYYQSIYENWTKCKLSNNNYNAEDTLNIILLWIYNINLAAGIKNDDVVKLLLKLYEDFDKLPSSTEIIISKFQDIPLEVIQNKGLFHKWLTQNKMKGNIQNDIIKKELSDIKNDCQKYIDKIFELINLNKINWPEVAINWAKINYLKDKNKINNIDFNYIEQQINNKFKPYIENEYSKLFYAGYAEKPLTIDRIIHNITCRPFSKVALICIDCMGMYDWNIIENYLFNKVKCNFKLNCVYAIIPTITSYSRQALFSGLKPSEFTGSSEEKAFREHLKNNWIKNDSEVNKIKLFINTSTSKSDDWYAYDFIGLIFNFLDNMIHNIDFNGQNKELIIKNLENTLEDLKFENVISGLLEKGYKVYLTSDHGSVICYGNGNNADRFLVDSKARRALIYNNYSLAKEFALKTNSNMFQNEDILGTQIAVLPNGREMFGNAKDIAISHGGTHIEEIIVPFVEVIN